MATPIWSEAPLVRGKVGRFTKTDQCGFPQITNSVKTTAGFISVKATKNQDSGDEIKVRQFDGTIGTFEPGQSSLLNFSLEINLVKVNPGLFTMLCGATTAVLDYAGVIVGWEELGRTLITTNFALELWTGTSAVACSAGSLLSGYTLYPMIGQGYFELDDYTDKEITGTIKAMSYGNPSWGRGPFGGVADGSSIRGPVATAASTPGRLLTAISPSAHRHFELTTIAAPTPDTTADPVTITLPTSY